MINILTAGGLNKCQDLFKKDHNGVSEPTHADSYINAKGEEIASETCMTLPEERLARVCFDFIFQYGLAMKEPCGLEVKDGSCQIEKCLIKGNKPYTQISDHYGLSLEIQYQGEVRQIK